MNSPAAAVRFVRNNTLQRSGRGYVNWVGESIGWWTIAYLIFWTVMFIIAGIQLLGVLDEPLALPVQAIMGGAATVFFAMVIHGAKSPPVFLNRRDVYRLALAPVVPLHPMRWPFIQAWLVRLAVGVLAGSVWAAVSPYWFHQYAWFAGPAVALLLIAHVNVRWIRYWQRNNPHADARVLFIVPLIAALALLGVFVPELGLTAAFTHSGPWVLLLPLAVATGSGWLVHTTLQREYPPRFAPQCFVLGELQAMRAMTFMAALAGQPGMMDPEYRARLLATLHDRPGVTRPRRSLRKPPVGAPQWRALAWRTWSMIYRRPWPAQVQFVFLMATVVTAMLLMQATGALGVLILAVLAGLLSSQLLGRGGYSSTLPLGGGSRTAGRSLPGAVVLVILTLAAVFLYPMTGNLPPPDFVLATLSLLLLVLVLLEKYSTWTGTPARRMEAWVVSALIASAPALLLGAFGAPGLTVPIQMGMLFLLAILPT